METRLKVLEIVFNAVKEINEDKPIDDQIILSEDSCLYGKKGKLDSLGLVTLIVAVEQKAEDEFGLQISISDEKAMSQKNSPFLTIESLTDYLLKVINALK